MDFVVPDNTRVKLKDSEKKDKYREHAVEHESDDYTNFNWCL